MIVKTGVSIVLGLYRKNESNLILSGNNLIISGVQVSCHSECAGSYISPTTPNARVPSMRVSAATLPSTKPEFNSLTPSAANKRQEPFCTCAEMLNWEDAEPC